MLRQKTKKTQKFRGSRTHGGGSPKKRRGAGNRGGRGNAGSGSFGDQKKHSYLKKYGKNYFGKRGFKCKGRTALLQVNVGSLHKEMDTFMKKGLVHEDKDKISLNLSKYKVLGQGELALKVHEITCAAISKVAKEKLEKAKVTVTVAE